MYFTLLIRVIESFSNFKFAKEWVMFIVYTVMNVFAFYNGSSRETYSHSCMYVNIAS